MQLANSTKGIYELPARKMSLKHNIDIVKIVHNPSNLFIYFFLNRLLDPQTNTEIANYPIYKILFCVRGHDGTPESDCFAFTESHYNAELFRIHVFRCEIQEAVSP